MTAAEFRARLGIALPIIQAPMAGVQGSAMAIAVSSAGGLGSLPCALLGAGQLRSELAAIAAGTSAPYNVNFFCHTNPDPNPPLEQRWRDRLRRYYDELGVDAASIPAGPGRTPFDAEAADMLEAARPPVVSFHFGLPDASLLARIRNWRPVVMSSATTVDEARWLEAHGVDAIIAQGVEAGGHRGMFLTSEATTQMGTFALLPQIVSAVEVPVIAAGGIADAAGVAAALRLGAAAVQIGTSYLLCPEATTSAVHRRALTSPAAQHTALTNVFTGRLARGIVNRLIAEVGPISPDAPPFPLATAAVGPLRTKAEQAGSGDFSPMWAGQNTSGCREIGAGDLTRALYVEAGH